MTDDSRQADVQYSGLVARAEELLSDCWGGVVKLGRLTRLSEPRGRSLVLRCEVANAPANAPASVVLKRSESHQYAPEDPKSQAAIGLFRDWAGLKFLNSFSNADLGCAEFYGGNRAAGFFLMEDMRDTVDLDHLLTRCSAEEASQGLQLLAETLGRMHASTIGHANDYQRIRDALGPGDNAQRRRLAKLAREYAPYLAERCERLRVPLAPNFEKDIQRVAEAMADPGEFLAYTHGDACPDNCRIDGRRLRLIDFEFGSFRHALLDGVYGWIRFPTCWCVRDIPESAVLEMEQAYRQALAQGCAAANDDATYYAAVAEACGFWLLENMADLFDRALLYETPKGASTNRQRILTRMDAFCRVARRTGHLDALRQTFLGMLERLRQRWQDDMPVYDAFTRTASLNEQQVADFVAAMQSADVPHARRLLENCGELANAKAAGKDQTPALYVAVGTQSRELVELLLSYGADWRLTTRTGWTVLSRACSHGTCDIVDLLLRQGANLNDRDKWGMLPIYGAVSSGNPAMLKHLLNRGARPDLKLAIDLDQLDLAKDLMSQDSSTVNMRFGTGLSLLHDSARVGDSRLEAMRLLLNFKANVDAATNWNATPLHLAAYYGHRGVVRLLIEFGADRSNTDRRGRTPQMLALGRGHFECAHWLKADVGNRGDNALEQTMEKTTEKTTERAGRDRYFAALDERCDAGPDPFGDLGIDSVDW